MALGFLMGARAPASQPIADAHRLPVDFSELVSSAFDNAMANNRFTSERSMLRETQDTQYEPILARAEAEIVGFDRMSVRQKAQQYYAMKKSKALGNRYARNDTEARYAAMADEFEPRGWEVPLYSMTEEEAANSARQTFEQYQEDQNFAVTNSPKWAMFFGEIGAAFNDPAQLAAMIAATPIALTTRTIAAAGIEGAINVAIDMPLLLRQKEWYAKQGRELTNEEMAHQLVFSFGLGSAIGAGTSALYRAAGGEGRVFLPVIHTGAEAGVGRYFNIDTAPSYGRLGVDHRQERPAWLTEAESEQMRIDANIQRKEQEYYDTSSDAVTGPYLNDVVIPHIEHPSPFKQTLHDGITGTLYKATKDNYVPGVTQLVSEIADTGRHYAYQPYHGHQYMANDTFTTHWLGKELDAAHATNMEEALLALQRGDAPSVPQKQALTAAMVVEDAPARFADLNELIAGEVTISMRSGPYRTWIDGKVREIMGPRMEQQVNAARADFPENRKPLTPQVTKPKTSEKQRLNREEKLAPKQVKITEARVALRSDKTKSVVFGKKWAKAQEKGETLKTPKGIRTADQLAAQQKRIDDMATQLADERKALNDENSAQIDYDDEVVRITAINDAMRMEADLIALNAGEMPNSLKGVRKRLNEFYTTLKDSPTLRADAMEAGAADRVKGMLGKPMTVQEAMGLTSRTEIQTPKQASATLDSLFIEIQGRNLDQDMSIPTLEGFTSTLREQMDEIEAVSGMSTARDVCGL